MTDYFYELDRQEESFYDDKWSGEKGQENFQEAVEAFFEAEGINNLSVEGSDDRDKCSICGQIVSSDPFFSWRNCECCNRPLGGNRYHASGYNPKTEQAYCYDVCEDCIYYAEYGEVPENF